jgi:hypothetical protein
MTTRADALAALERVMRDAFSFRRDTPMPPSIKIATMDALVADEATLRAHLSGPPHLPASAVLDAANVRAAFGLAFNIDEVDEATLDTAAAEFVESLYGFGNGETPTKLVVARADAVIVDPPTKEEG